jgi:excisionase family DNA binding protein
VSKSSRPNFSRADATPFPRRFITVAEFCEAYGVSRQKFYDLLNAGFLEAPLVGGSMRRVSVDSAEKLFAESSSAVKAGPMTKGAKS